MYFSAFRKPIIIIVLVFCLGFPLSAREEIYRSNEIGMTLEKISEYRRDEFEYVLSISRADNRTVKTLFKDGKESKKWIREPEETNKTIVSYYEDGNRKEETVYEADRVIEERFYTDGELTETHKYFYFRDVLSRVEVFGSEGEKLYELQYLHTSGGRLKQVRKIIMRHEKSSQAENGTTEGTPENGTESESSSEASTEEIKISNYMFSRGNLLESWHGDEHSGDFFRFTDKGDVLSHEQWEETTLIAIEERKTEKDEEGRVTVSENLRTGTIRYTYYDEDGNVVREKAEQDGRLIEEIRYTYEDGNMVYKRKHTPGLLEEWYYSSDQSNELQEKEYFKNGEIRKKTYYTAEDSYREEIYRKGEPFLLVFFEDDVKIREEFIYDNE